MSFYEELQATASRLLDEFGQDLTLRRPSFELYDPITGVTDATEPTLLPTIGITQKMQRGMFANVQTGDRALVLDGAVQPKQGDHILIDGVVWSIVEIAEANPAGTPLVYFVQIRR